MFLQFICYCKNQSKAITLDGARCTKIRNNESDMYVYLSKKIVR